ncbi:hypothetical protein [Burkholderia alba]|uniref:hypothetical protein n=1 Tax=Burkholderia alba TaxID=2683677 RepID=UPI002B06066C|nr:hypothetical protein [Burkholderia alba]
MAVNQPGNGPESGAPTRQSAEFALKVRSLIVLSISLLVMFGIISCYIPIGSKLGYFLSGAIAIAIAGSLRFLQIRYPGRFVFTDLRTRALAWRDSLERHQQFYLNIALCIPFLAYTYVLDEKWMFVQVFQLFVIYCVIVAANDIIRIYVALSNTLVGKGLIALGFAVGSNFAFCFSGWIIGEMTHVAPSTFPHTLSFLAIVAIPFLFLIAGAIYLPFVVLSVPFIWLASDLEKRSPGLMKWIFARKFEKPARRYVIATLLFQAFFYSFVAAMLPKMIFSSMSRHGEAIESTIAGSIYAFDMYPGTACGGEPGYRVAGLGDENYMLARKTPLGVVFDKPKKCTL